MPKYQTYSQSRETTSPRSAYATSASPDGAVALDLFVPHETTSAADAVARVDDVFPAVPEQVVPTWPSPERVLSGAPAHRVVPGVSPEDVRGLAANKHVVPFAPLERVAGEVCADGGQPVVAGEADDEVGEVGPDKRVVPVRSDDSAIVGQPTADRPAVEVLPIDADPISAFVTGRVRDLVAVRRPRREVTVAGYGEHRTRVDVEHSEPPSADCDHIVLRRPFERADRASGTIGYRLTTRVETSPSLNIVRPDGSGRAQLVGPGTLQSAAPRWSHDGAQIAFHLPWRRHGTWQLGVVTASTAVRRRRSSRRGATTVGAGRP